LQPFSAHDAALSKIGPRPQLRRLTSSRLLREALESLVLVATIDALVNLASERFIVEGDSMQLNLKPGSFGLSAVCMSFWAVLNTATLWFFTIAATPELITGPQRWGFIRGNSNPDNSVLE
jgi:hypothetical protein